MMIFYPIEYPPTQRKVEEVQRATQHGAEQASRAKESAAIIM